MKTITDTLQVSRSNQYERERIKRGRYTPQPGDERYLSLIREITDGRPTYGYRRVATLLRRSLKEPVNHKRVYRIMKIHHLLLPRYTGRLAASTRGRLLP